MYIVLKIIACLAHTLVSVIIIFIIFTVNFVQLILRRFILPIIYDCLVCWVLVIELVEVGRGVKI